MNAGSSTGEAALWGPTCLNRHAKARGDVAPLDAARRCLWVTLKLLCKGCLPPHQPGCRQCGSRAEQHCTPLHCRFLPPTMMASAGSRRCSTAMPIESRVVESSKLCRCSQVG